MPIIMPKQATVRCSIVLNDEESGLYRPGDTLTGYVNIMVSGKAVVQPLTISITGQRTHTTIESYTAGRPGSGCCFEKTVRAEFYKEEVSLLEQYNEHINSHPVSVVLGRITDHSLESKSIVGCRSSTTAHLPASIHDTPR